MIKFLICLSSMFLSTAAISNSCYGWGYSKNDDNIRPYIGKYEEELRDTNSFYVGNENDKVVYLTFDAGYDNGNMIDILNILDEKKVKGAFFLTGDFLNRFEDLVIEINNRGHIIGNHTWSHKNITKLNKEELENDVLKYENKLKEIIKSDVDYFFRPPEGLFNKTSLNYIKQLGYNTIFWSVAYKDWDTNNQNCMDKAVNSVIKNLHNGAIILLHSVSKDNVKALPVIIDKIKEEGYEIKTLYNLFNS